MAIDLNTSPYFDDYDPSKNYTKIVGVPGRVSQVREFTQAQDIQQDFLKRLGNTVHRNGEIISGCNVVVKPKQVEISEGQIFLDGLIRIVKTQIVPIRGEGTENIGITMEQQLITEKEDQSLYDNADGYRNYGNAGAHRIKETPRWVTSGEMVPVFEIIDNQLSISSATSSDSDDTMDQVTEVLARRTFDENGSYKVNGLKIINRGQIDENKLYVQVQEGKAYIGGYEVDKKSASLIGIDKSDETRTQYNESFTFIPEVTYPLNNSPVKSIDELDCMVQKTKDMTRGEIEGGFDHIDDDREGSVVEITKVIAGTTEYHPVQDYVFKEGGISWEPTGGAEPATGTSYKVTYKFLQRMKDTEYKISHIKAYRTSATYTINRGLEDTDTIPVPAEDKIVDIKRVYSGETEYTVTTDWKLSGVQGGYSIDWSANQSKPEGEYNIDLVVLTKSTDDSREYIEFTSPETPIMTDTQFSADYTFYLARADLIVMNPNQVCDVVKGTPDTLYRVFAPTNTNDRLLPIGTVLVYPNSNQMSITNFDNYRLSQEELYNVRKRVDNLEYDIAMSDLDREAMEGETPTLLKGVFTDGFIGPTKADVTHTDFDCSFDFDHGYLLLPQNEGIKGMKYSKESTAKVLGGIASAPFTNELMISQKAATLEFPVNPYAVYHSLAILEADPYVDNWVDSTRLTVDAGTNYVDKYEEVNGGTTYVNGGTTRRTVTRGGIFRDYDEVSTNEVTSHSSETTKRTDESYRTQSDIILDEAIEYMRPVVISLKGSNYTLNADNLTCYFNNQKININPTGQTLQGTEPGTIKSDENGKFEARITVPEGTPCGTVDILVRNENNTGGTRFSAQGRRQIIQDSVFRTVTTTTTRTNYTTVTQYTTVTTIHDPLAQSFYVSDDCVLTQIGLFFSKKDNQKNIILEIRELNDGGMPSATILHQQVVQSNDVLIDDKGQKETLINLSQPLYLQGDKSYCFVIVSDSDKYSMWSAQLGGVDEYSYDTKYQVVSNPYTEGVMFSSSNAQSWTIHQDQDLKFNIYRARYSANGVVSYPDTPVNEASALVLAAQTADFNNQGIDWTFSEPSDDGKVTWQPIKEFDYLELDKQISSVALKCELKTSNDMVSPFLNVDSVNLVYYSNEGTGTYVSRQVVMEQSFNTLQTSIEAYTPDGTSFKMYYTLANDNSGWTELTSPSVTRVDQFFSRYTFTKDSLPENNNKCRIKIEMSSTDKLHTPVLRRLISIMKNV